MKEGLMSLITEGSRIEGKVSFNGSVRIDGTIDGEIVATEKVIVGNTGHIKGKVKCQSFTSSGKCEGTFEVAELTELLKGATLEGELSCKKLIVEEGVILDGNVMMKERKFTKKEG
jgi:cytoskeletal protein CcmA (bactofilin family)|uniref:Polymer-forming cytoskeletal protein n=1 Tax=candidate division WOR-3 bacterium TaxID=2052148 RepID=A0A7C4YG29_UNCW3